MKKNTAIIVSCLLIVLLPAFTFAFPAGEGGQPGKRGHKFMRMLKQLDLSVEQKQQIKGVFEEQKDTMKESREALREARQAFAEVMRSGTASESEVRARHQAMSDLGGEVAVKRYSMQKEIRSILTETQRAELDALKAERAEKRRARFQEQRGKRD